MNLFVSLMQANKNERESHEEAERERLATEEEARRSAVLTEWERICSPPQNIEVCLLMASLILSRPVYLLLCLSYLLSLGAHARDTVIVWSVLSFH